MIVEDENGRKRFEFQRGPLFSNIILGDEINRATPKTQSALLEAMQERHVTVGGIQYDSATLPGACHTEPAGNGRHLRPPRSPTRPFFLQAEGAVSFSGWRRSGTGSSLTSKERPRAPRPMQSSRKPSAAKLSAGVRTRTRRKRGEPTGKRALEPGNSRSRRNDSGSHRSNNGGLADNSTS